jgi:hypothetical protein
VDAFTARSLIEPPTPSLLKLCHLRPLPPPSVSSSSSPWSVCATSLLSLAPERCPSLPSVPPAQQHHRATSTSLSRSSPSNCRHRSDATISGKTPPSLPLRSWRHIAIGAVPPPATHLNPLTTRPRKWSRSATRALLGGPRSPFSNQAEPTFSPEPFLNLNFLFQFRIPGNLLKFI